MVSWSVVSRVSIKVTGAQGQGLNSVGEVLAKALKRSGYCVFGYREYNSLIKGGHTSYQLDVSHEEIRSSESHVDILVCLNHHGLQKNLRELKKGGILIHDTTVWKFPKDDQAFIMQEGIHVVLLPIEEILRSLKARPILANVILTSFMWKLLKRDVESLKALVTDQYKHKGEKVVAKNMECIDAGQAFDPGIEGLGVHLSDPDPFWKDHLLVTGSQAMGLGVIHAGCRVYVSYPMTPASPLLSYIAEKQQETGMVIKQAEDEITAAQMVTGAAMMGTRAATGTSGGGFDLMTETFSLNGIIENPAVFILASRPGPGTGLPTWTAQGDLLLACNCAHGEFPRCVIAVSDATSCFTQMMEVFNIAEEYQTPVIVLTDKHIAEALWTAEAFDQNETTVRRGRLVGYPSEGAGSLPATKDITSADRYDPNAEDGISLRWLPGMDLPVFCAQGDEHRGDGSVDESAENAQAQITKRMKKMEALKRQLPEPDLYVLKDGEVRHETSDIRHETSVDVLFVGWGSTKGAVLDVLKELEEERSGKRRGSIAYLHYTYLWPLKTEKFVKLAESAKKVILIEGNKQGQLGMLLAQESGVIIKEKILRYDGRPFFADELMEQISILL